MKGGMTGKERTLIWHFVRCNSNQGPLRDFVIEVYRRCLRDGTNKGELEMLYMSEIDTVCPDLALRANYRKRLIELIESE